MTRRPRPAASRAIPVPLMPPPTTSTSTCSGECAWVSCIPGILPRAFDASNVGAMESLDDLQPGRLVRLSARVQRLVAPNASLMTGPGTNSYVLGSPAVAVLDPGPDDPAHLAKLRAAAPDLRFVFVTHTHRDHSCGARALADATGAQIVGLPPPADGLQDMSCVPTVEARHDSVFEINGREAAGGPADG